MRLEVKLVKGINTFELRCYTYYRSYSHIDIHIDLPVVVGIDLFLQYFIRFRICFSKEILNNVDAHNERLSENDGHCQN